MPIRDYARFPVVSVVSVLRRLFICEGLDADKARSVSEALVRADMMGHHSHGVALVPWYMQALTSGQMARQGEPAVLSDRGACIAWQGNRLPGAWLLDLASDLLIERSAQFGVVTLTIAGAHHTGALAVYLPRFTERGLMPIISCSGPAAQGVAPYGGRQGVFTPNPLACGIPSTDDPILIDISASITTTNRARQLTQAGELFPAEWVLDAQGCPTRDPAALTSGGGTLLPVGGLDHGHKGYAMALLVEALTQGLSGLGRHTAPTGVLMNVFLQVIDPGAFGGADAFKEEMSWLRRSCRDNPPRPGVERVRVPGEHGLAEMRRAQEQGVLLPAAALSGLGPYLNKHELQWPDCVEAGSARRVEQ
ncbi:Ldh family oxidoreductase [Candidimonas nitroreducens]|uniref:Lactate dehydrogenase n=1 Tax=Candidimonas nitroreducens TaxID=683354 RepID=A0A225MYH6_9BURK|nr:Ldh family oxidoreductase [Candidimonas nitroreducens]OWT66174.1 lactate dehydrogenase [Candidimonas nitroreducens]